LDPIIAIVGLFAISEVLVFLETVVVGEQIKYKVERTYATPGTYSEILKVIDARGRIAYDFATVHVMDKEQPDKLPPIVHATYAPTDGIHPNDPVTFKVRTFRAKTGNETWDFGDGTQPVTVHSDANANRHDPNGYAETVHHFTKPGRYLVRVEGRGDDAAVAIAHLQIHVDEKTVNRARPTNEAGKASPERPLGRVGQLRQGERSSARLELPVLGLDDRSEPPWQRGLSDREEDRVGLREPARDQRAGSRAVHPATRVPQGLGRYPESAARAAAREGKRVAQTTIPVRGDQPHRASHCHL